MSTEFDKSQIKLIKDFGLFTRKVPFLSV